MLAPLNGKDIDRVRRWSGIQPSIPLFDFWTRQTIVIRVPPGRVIFPIVKAGN
jgi:hypothetical protein